MDLNPIDWSRARELLVQLVQALSPVANGGTPTQNSIASLKKNFFTPPSETSAAPQTLQNRLLIILQSARQEMAALIEKLPEPNEEKLSTPEKLEGKSAAPEKGSGEKQPVRNREAPLELKPVSRPLVDDKTRPLNKEPMKSESEKGGGEAEKKDLSQPLKKETVEGVKRDSAMIPKEKAVVLKKESNGPSPRGKDLPAQNQNPQNKGERPLAPKSMERRPFSLENRPNSTISGKAGMLIDQVADASRILSTSGNLKDPKAAPLRSALERLQPLIDDLILAVSQGEMSHSDEGHPRSSFRFAVPKSPRENLFKKEIPFPRQEPKEKQAPANSFTAVRTPPRPPNERIRLTPEPKRGGEISVPPRPNGSVREKEALRKSEFAPKPLEDTVAPSPASVPRKPGELILNPQLPANDFFSSSTKQPSKIETQQEARAPERLSLPAAPYTPQATPPLREKKKKKRKSFWSREKDNSKDP